MCMLDEMGNLLPGRCEDMLSSTELRVSVSESWLKTSFFDKGALGGLLWLSCFSIED